MKYFFSLLLFVASFFAFAQNDSLVVKGRLKGQGNQKVFLSFTDAEGRPASYVAEAKDDRFVLKVKKQLQPIVARFNTALNRSLSKTVNGQTFANPAPALELFVSQSDVEIEGTAEELHLASVKGGKENNEFLAYRKAVQPLEKRRWEMLKQALLVDAHKDSAAYKSLLAQSLANSKKQAQIQKEFIQNNPAAFASLFLLSRMENMYTTGDYETAFNSLSDDYKNTALAQKIAKRIAFLSPTAVGKPAVTFVKTDKDGNEINLAAYKGRLVLLDFWGSWCGPCRASHPHLKELYKKYKGKGFEIIAIAAEKARTPEEQRKAWLGAIEKDGIPWVHLLNNEEAKGQDLVKAYRVTAFPTKILLDKDGKILLRITASATDDIDRALAKIYGE
jgi:thiol-disulfide isomerase/thioredoxin